MEGGSGVEQSRGDADRATAGGHVEGSGARDAARGIYFRTGADEQVDKRGALRGRTFIGKAVERGVATAIEEVRDGTEFEE